MESLNPWLLLVAGLLVGSLVGGLVILTMERRQRGSDADIRLVRRELDDYRQEVAEHYVETAKRVNQLTHAYKSVYDHLEDGAYRLVGEQELRRRLDDTSTEPVMLEGIGQRSLHRPEDEDRPIATDAGADPYPAGTATTSGTAGAYAATTDAPTPDVGAYDRPKTAATGADPYDDAATEPAHDPDADDRSELAGATSADATTSDVPTDRARTDEATDPDEPVDPDADDEARRA